MEADGLRSLFCLLPYSLPGDGLEAFPLRAVSLLRVKLGVPDMKCFETIAEGADIEPSSVGEERVFSYYPCHCLFLQSVYSILCTYPSTMYETRIYM